MFRTKNVQQRLDNRIFSLKKSNINFIPISNSNTNIIVNKTAITFDEGGKLIPVNIECRDLICIGNNSNHKMKEQFSIIKSSKYTIQTNPEVVELEPRYTCEFEIFITIYEKYRIGMS